MSDDIFHIAAATDWLAAVETGTYTTSTRGRRLQDEGFIHASRADQWCGVREAFYRDCDEALVLLRIDTGRLGVPVVTEAVAPGGEDFPHLYGPLSPTAVTEVRIIARSNEPRGELAMLAAERPSLDGWLDFMRDTVALKLDGLTPEQLAARPVPPSTLSLLGLVRHLSEVERYWLLDVAGGAASGTLYCADDVDGDFNDARPDTALQDWCAFVDVIRQVRAAAAAVPDLDTPLPGLRRGRQVNLRWVLTHLIEEYSRHLGHADLLREAIDGRTGY